jgi:hypothetical protein
MGMALDLVQTRALAERKEDENAGFASSSRLGAIGNRTTRA